MRVRANIANIITSLRIIAGVIFITHSKLLMTNKIYFLVLYGAAILTDILDGYIARKLKISSEFGAWFDALTDNFIVVSIIIMFLRAKKWVLIKYYEAIIFMIGYYFLLQIISLLKTRRLFRRRNYMALVSATIFPIMIIEIVLFDKSKLAFSYAIITLFSITEKLYLHLSNSSHKSIFSEDKRTIVMFLVTFFIITALLIQLLNTKTKLCFISVCIDVEVMKTPAQHMIGLMYRDKLEQNKGMLFIFKESKKYGFWMKNMNFPIDIIFVREDMIITDIYKNVQPCNTSCPTYYPKTEIKYVIEVNANFSNKHNIKPGQKVFFNVN